MNDLESYGIRTFSRPCSPPGQGGENDLSRSSSTFSLIAKRRNYRTGSALLYPNLPERAPSRHVLLYRVCGSTD